MNTRLAAQGAVVAAAILLAIGAASAGQFGRAYAEAAYIGTGVKDFAELSERFTLLAKEKGGAYAFEILRRAPLPPHTDLHLLGHVIGDELYLQKGIEGIADCTQDFRNACSHSIVIGALSEYGGETALPLIRESCRKAPGGNGAYTMCYHGLGHGVFAYFGYSLPETVDFCAKTGTEEYHQQEYTECVGGAIMELMGGGGHDPELWQQARDRYLRADDPLALCLDNLIPESLKPMCLVYLTPELLVHAGADLARPDPTFFPAAFAYCDAIPSVRPLLREACFGGFGKEFVPLAGARDIRDIANFTDEEFLTAIKWCDAAEAKDGAAACVAEGLASIFWGGENDPAAALRFCNLVSDGPSQTACWARLVHDIKMYLPQDEQVSLCNALPGPYGQDCIAS